jgi:hypothetical protein
MACSLSFTKIGHLLGSAGCPLLSQVSHVSVKSDVDRVFINLLGRIKMMSYITKLVCSISEPALILRCSGNFYGLDIQESVPTN